MKLLRTLFIHKPCQARFILVIEKISMWWMEGEGFDLSASGKGDADIISVKVT